MSDYAQLPWELQREVKALVEQTTERSDWPLRQTLRSLEIAPAIDISFQGGDPSDPFPFDDAGGVLGQPFFPGTLLAGRIHLCAAENWALQPGEGRERRRE